MKVIQSIDPSSSKKSRNSLVKRVAVPLCLTSAMKDSERSLHRPDWHSSNRWLRALPKPIRIIPFSRHSFSQLPPSPSLMYRTRVGLIFFPARVALVMHAPSSQISNAGQEQPRLSECPIVLNLMSNKKDGADHAVLEKTRSNFSYTETSSSSGAATTSTTCWMRADPSLGSFTSQTRPRACSVRMPYQFMSNSYQASPWRADCGCA